MKLYSKTQFIRAIAAAVVITAAAAIFIDRNIDSFASFAGIGEAASQPAEAQRDFENQTTAESYPVFEQSAALPLRPVADASGFTEDEQQNINVYDRCAESVVNISTKIAGVNWFLEPIVD